MTYEHSLLADIRKMMQIEAFDAAQVEAITRGLERVREGIANDDGGGCPTASVSAEIKYLRRVLTMLVSIEMSKVFGIKMGEACEMVTDYMVSAEDSESWSSLKRE